MSTKKRMSLEVCTDDGDAWTTFLSICAEAFQDHAAFKRSHPNSEERKIFIPLYLKYFYEAELSGGRAGLVCVKVNDGDSNTKIIYGFCGIYPNSKKLVVDRSAMKEVSQLGMQRCFAEDEWIERNVHEKMRKIFDSMDVTYINFAYQACAKEYRNRGIGTKYMRRAGDLILYDGIKRGRVPANKPAIAYGVLDDARAKRFNVDYGSTEVAHLHYRFPPSYAVKCVEDANEKESEDFNCISIICQEIGEQNFVMEYFRKALLLRSLL